MTVHNVLILAVDRLAAALLGGAVELAGHRAHFVRASEPAREALRRTRARVALVDGDHDEGCSDAFLGPALMMATRVILFRSRRTQRDVEPLVARLGLAVLELPDGAEALAEGLGG